MLTIVGNPEHNPILPHYLRCKLAASMIQFRQLFLTVAGWMVRQCLPTYEVRKHWQQYHDLRAHPFCSCAMLPLTGKIYTYFSSKKTYITFLCVFEIGSLVCAAAKTSKVFIVGRAIGGAGQAGLVNGAITIITTIAPLDQRPMLIGWILSMSSIGAVVGPLIGGAITQNISWRW
jgi:Major Facilitator Superfamily